MTGSSAAKFKDSLLNVFSAATHEGEYQLKMD